MMLFFPHRSCWRVVNSHRSDISPLAKRRLCNKIIQRMEAFDDVLSAFLASFEKDLRASTIVLIARNKGQFAVKSAKMRFANALIISRKSLASSGTDAFSAFLTFAKSCTVTEVAESIISAWVLIRATSSSSRLAQTNGDRPSIALTNDGLLIFPSFPTHARFTAILSSVLVSGTSASS